MQITKYEVTNEYFPNTATVVIALDDDEEYPISATAYYEGEISCVEQYASIEDAMKNMCYDLAWSLKHKSETLSAPLQAFVDKAEARELL